MTQSLKFLGNTSATFQTKDAAELECFLKCLTEEEEMFKDVAPLLFSSNFLTTAKDHTESVKALDKLSSQSGRPTRQHFTVRPPLQPSCSRGRQLWKQPPCWQQQRLPKRQFPRKRSLQAIPGEGPVSKKAAAAATSNSSHSRACSLHTTDCVCIQKFNFGNMCAAKTSYCHLPQ